MKKKVAAVIIMAIVGIASVSGDVYHTIKTVYEEGVKKEKSIIVKIGSEGIKRKIKIPAAKNATVRVGYKDSSGYYYIENNGKWEKSDKIEKYYKYVEGLNSTVISSDGPVEIDEIGYYEGGESEIEEKREIAVEIRDTEDINIIVIESAGKIKVLKFRDRYGLGNITAGEYSSWKKWLKSSSKEENKKYSKISQRAYLSLKSDTPYKYLYEKDGNYLGEYLKIPYEKKKYKNMLIAVLKANIYKLLEIKYQEKKMGEEAEKTLDEKTEELIKMREKGELIKERNIEKTLFNEGLNNKELLRKLTGIEKNDLRSLLDAGEIVPELKEVKAGDIVFFNKKGKEESGIVVAGEGSYESIEVIYMNEAERKITKESLAKIKETEEDLEIVIIRLLEEAKEDISNEEWNVLNDKIEEVKIEIGTMRESTQKSKEKHRWIPNTGEYLEVGDIKVITKTAHGIEKKSEERGISFIGAEDRGFSENAETGKGNIYKNKANKYEIWMDVTLNGTQKEMEIKREIEKEEGKKEYKIQGEEIHFNIADGGDIIDGAGKKLKIKIRPEKDQIYPGDDLLLKFKMGDKEYTVEAKDYIAVYDKKMMWRANLYIDETEERLYNLDWNNAHLWNTEDKEIEWNAVNKWNKKYNLATDKEKTGETLINLEKGSGGQVVTFTGWTPLRKNPNVKRAENYYADRVAYDYPQEKNDKEKYINAWDSPFDFVYKMKLQREAIREKFQKEIEVKEEQKEGQENTEKEKEDKKKSKGKFYNEDGTEISGNEETIEKLAKWEETTSPNNKWRYYIREGEKGTVPGVGLFIHKPAHSYNDVIYDAEKEGSVKIEKINRKSAGADCIGFAERTASYDGNKYKWKDLPKGWIEGSDPDKTVRYENGIYVTQYPQTGEASNIILSKENIGAIAGEQSNNDFFIKNVNEYGGPIKEELDSIKAQFEKVIPGDVITYAAGDSKHIGVITDVNYEGIEKAQSIVSIMDNIQVIESNYGSHINYVKKGMSTDGFASTINGKTLLLGSWFYDWATNGIVSIRNFQIERLIIEE